MAHTPPINKDGTVSRRWKHGYSQEPLYTIWRTMLRRCYTPIHNRYQHYGGPGITVCEAWWDYPTFRKWAIRAGYRSGLQIDRINPNGPYEPRNCRWATPKEQQRNKRNNRNITYKGITKSLAEWAEDERCVVSYSILWERLENGWSFEKALLTPQRRANGYRLITAFGETKSITEWVQDPRCPDVSLSTIWWRINHNWPAERAITTPARARPNSLNHEPAR